MVGGLRHAAHIRTVSAIVGLLPLRVQRQRQLTCQRGEVELIADSRYGMPDARDLRALLLCVDAALRGASCVSARPPVSAISLLRIAGLRLHLHRDAPTPVLAIARQWSSDVPTVVLTARWSAWVRQAPRSAELCWDTLQQVSPGAVALAVALATAERTSISMSRIAAQCGSQAAEQRSANQQVRRWLKDLHRAGLDDWVADRDRAVVFRRARLDDSPARLQRMCSRAGMESSSMTAASETPGGSQKTFHRSDKARATASRGGGSRPKWSRG